MTDLRLVPRLGATIDRRDLSAAADIVERMARDILAARRDGEHGALIDLTEAGWTAAQAMRWGSAAHALALEPGFATQDVVDRLALPAAPTPTDHACEAAVAAALGVDPGAVANDDDPTEGDAA